MQNFITLEQALLWEKYVAQKEKEKKKKNNTKYSGHFVPQQPPRAVHALRSDQQKDFCVAVKVTSNDMMRFLSILAEGILNHWFRAYQ